VALARATGASVEVRNYLMLLSMVPSFVIAVIEILTPGHHDVWGFRTTLGLASLAPVFVLILFRLRAPPPTRMSVQFGPAAVDLVVNGRAERVLWYAVSEAFELTDGFAIKRRDDQQHPIFIPKRVLSDGGRSLWGFLEDRLTGSLPEIRALGFDAPTRLQNTVDQFLSVKIGGPRRPDLKQG